MVFGAFAPATPSRARSSRRRPRDDDPFADQFPEYDDDEEERAHKSKEDLTKEEADDLREDDALLDRDHHRHGAALAAWFGATGEGAASLKSSESQPARAANGQFLDTTMAEIGAAFDVVAERQGRDRTVRQAQAGHNALLERFNADHPSNTHLAPDDPQQTPRLRPLKVDGVSGPKTRFNLRHMAALAGPEAIVAAHDAGAEILAPTFDTPAARLRARQADRHGLRNNGATDSEREASSEIESARRDPQRSVGQSMSLDEVGRRAGEFVSGANEALYETLGGPIDAANWALRQPMRGAGHIADALGLEDASDALHERADAQHGGVGSSQWIAHQADRVIPDIAPTDETGRDLRAAGGAVFDLASVFTGGGALRGTAAGTKLVNDADDLGGAIIGPVEDVIVKSPRAGQAWRELVRDLPGREGDLLDRVLMVAPSAIKVAGAPKAGTKPAVALGQFGARGEATGMVAILDRTSLHTGTATRRRWPRGEPDVAGLREVQGEFARAHLLARLLGGAGDNRRNLTALSRKTNQEMLDEVEKKVRRAIEAGETVRYAVAPRYRRGATAPYKVELRARGSGGFSLDRELINDLKEPQ